MASVPTSVHFLFTTSLSVTAALEPPFHTAHRLLKHRGKKESVILKELRPAGQSYLCSTHADFCNVVIA